MFMYLFLASLFILILLNVPLFVCLSLSSIIYMFASGQSFLIQMMAPRIFAGMNNFPLLAIPLFILCGDFLTSGKVSDVLLDFANSLFGFVRGSLSIVTTIACMFFGAVSGSAVATASAIGTVVVPEIEKRGYNKEFMAAIIASSGPLGILIPPSIPMVLYGAVTGTSIANLLLAGVGPGIIYGSFLCGYGYWYSRKKGYCSVAKFNISNVMICFKKSIWAMFSPIIVLGGIYSGLFTPTEAAGVAAIYSLFVGMFIYKAIKWKDLQGILLKSSITNATIMIITAAIILFNWVLAREQIPQLLTHSVLLYINTPIQFLFFSALVVLIAGMFIDIPAAIILLAPLFLPLLKNFNIDPVFFGALMVSGLAIGLITPPVALTLYISSMVVKVDVTSIIKEIIPIIFVLIAGLIIFILCPNIIMFLPNIFGI